MGSNRPDEDDLAERLLEAMVYVPLGLALEAKDLLPKLAERGRGQIALTRLAGTVAARQGQQRAEAMVDELRDSVTSFFGEPAAAPSEPAPAAADTTDKVEAEPELELPIDGYADLTAVQVIPLLAGLSPSELDAIEAFELEHRSRRTVLNRIAQRRSS